MVFIQKRVCKSGTKLRKRHFLHHGKFPVSATVFLRYCKGDYNLAVVSIPRWGYVFQFFGLNFSLGKIRVHKFPYQY